MSKTFNKLRVRQMLSDTVVTEVIEAGSAVVAATGAVGQLQVANGPFEDGDIARYNAGTGLWERSTVLSELLSANNGGFLATNGVTNVDASAGNATVQGQLNSAGPFENLSVSTPGQEDRVFVRVNGVLTFASDDMDDVSRGNIDNLRRHGTQWYARLPASE